MRRGLLALGIFVLALGVAEGLARWDEGPLTFPTDGRRYATRPGAHGTNSRGFFEREFSDVPTARRILVLGDSVTHGLTTPADAWPRVAEALSPGTEWLNLAHYGYDAAQELAVLRGTTLSPSAVIYAAYLNDLVPTELITVGPRARPEYLGEGGLFPLALRQRSAALRHLDGAWMVRRVRETPDVEAWSTALAGMKAEAARQGARFFVVGLVPHVIASPRGCVDELGLDGCRAVSAQSAEIEDEVRRLGVPFLDITPALRASGQPAFFADQRRDPHHPSPEGHRVIGAAVAAWFAEVGG